MPEIIQNQAGRATGVPNTASQRQNGQGAIAFRFVSSLPGRMMNVFRAFGGIATSLFSCFKAPNDRTSATDQSKAPIDGVSAIDQSKAPNDGVSAIDQNEKEFKPRCYVGAKGGLKVKFQGTQQFQQIPPVSVPKELTGVREGSPADRRPADVEKYHVETTKSGLKKSFGEVKENLDKKLAQLLPDVRQSNHDNSVPKELPKEIGSKLEGINGDVEKSQEKWSGNEKMTKWLTQFQQEVSSAKEDFKMLAKWIGLKSIVHSMCSDAKMAKEKGVGNEFFARTASDLLKIKTNTDTLINQYEERGAYNERLIVNLRHQSLRLGLLGQWFKSTAQGTLPLVSLSDIEKG